MNWFRTLLPLLALAIVLLTIPDSVSACPNCKEAYTGEGASLAASYSESILFMMAMPFLVLGAVALRIWFRARKHRTTSDLPLN